MSVFNCASGNEWVGVRRRWLAGSAHVGVRGFVRCAWDIFVEDAGCEYVAGRLTGHTIQRFFCQPHASMTEILLCEHCTFCFVH